MVKCLLFLSFLGIGSQIAVVYAATNVELEACKLTPEVKQQLTLTPDQEPKVTKIFSDLAPMREQIDQAIARLDELRRTKADPAAVADQTKKLIELEHQCRDRAHQLLKPVLSDAQFAKILEMEEVHQKKVRERQAARSSGNP